MTINVSLGDSLCAEKGKKTLEITFKEGEEATILEISKRLEIELRGPEGSLMVLVNGEILPDENIESFKLTGGDNVTIMRMLSGG